MEKSNLELFKQAISEGLSNKFDSVVNSYTDEIVCSEKHELAMRTIVRGKIDTKRVHSPKMKQIIAILVAAALILTSCGIIFRNEIREIFENMFMKLTYSDEETRGDIIEEVYELSYLPDGYYLDKEEITLLSVYYSFKNEKNGNSDYIWFEQKLLDGTDFFVDNEDGYSRINEILNIEVYYRYTDENHVYVWNDGKCSMKLKLSEELSIQEISLILEGLAIK